MKKKVPDLEAMVLQVQQQITFLDKKIDALISQCGQTSRPPEVNHGNRPQETRPPSDRGQRIMHKVVCADCHKECEVPFRPSGDRPVYCRDCFAKRKTTTQFKPSGDNRPRESRGFHERPSYGRGHTSETSKPYGKKSYDKKPYDKKPYDRKRPSVKGRKKRS